MLKECVLVALKTGLRANEVARMKWADLDQANSRIKVVGKNGEIDYVFPPPSIFDMLEERKGSPSELVFPAPKSGEVRRDFENFANLCNDLGYNEHVTDPRERVSFHTLRHTYASWLVIAGIPLYDVSKLMRHKSIKMTERYAKLAPNYMHKAVAFMDSYQPSSPPKQIVKVVEVKALP